MTVLWPWGRFEQTSINFWNLIDIILLINETLNVIRLWLELKILFWIRNLLNLVVDCYWANNYQYLSWINYHKWSNLFKNHSLIKTKKNIRIFPKIDWCMDQKLNVQLFEQNSSRPFKIWKIRKILNRFKLQELA